MKDSKEMWAVSSDLTYGKVNALYDIEDNKATHYAFDGSTAYSEVDERSVKLFNTEAEAKNYIEEHIEYLKSKDQEIYNLLREMEYIKNNNCEREIQFSIFSRLELLQERPKRQMGREVLSSGWQVRASSANTHNRLLKYWGTDIQERGCSSD